MGIRDRVSKINYDKLIKEEKNPYLADSKKGLELLYRILPGINAKHKEQKAVRRLDWLIDDCLIDTLHELPIENTANLIKRFERLSDRLMEYGKVNLLKGKDLVGVGGQFSAGKSRFINSLIGKESNIQLPEDQVPTTAIPTYIVGGETDEIQAFCSGSRVVLDVDAMQALTHEFYKQYQIALGRFVSFIAIQNSHFPTDLSDTIAFLDTPGYSKADIATKQNITDEKVAFKQLQRVDYLIWLVNSGRGAITDSDIEFLHGLDYDIPTLVVFTRADQQTEDNLREIITTAQNTLEEENVNTFAVTAYDSIHGEEFDGKHHIKDFFEAIKKRDKNRKDAFKELQMMLNDLDGKFDDETENIKEDMRLLKKCIWTTKNVLSIPSLVKLYGDNRLNLDRLQERWFYGNNNFNYIRKQIKQNLEKLL